MESTRMSNNIADRVIVFVNASGDTFTPTASGSLGPWIWEVCRAAQAQGIEPMVVSKRKIGVKPYDWPYTTLVDWPTIPRGRLFEFVLKVNRKLTGWAEFGQGVFARRTAGIIQKLGADKLPIFLQNDPEMAVFLRRRFPNSFIICHFQNQQECRPRFRSDFARSVNRVTACSRFTARWIEQYYALPTDGVVPIYSGVDSERFRPAPPPDSPLVINFTGRTGVEKGPDLLLEAAVRIKSEEPTLNFCIQLLGSSISGSHEWNPFQRKLKRQMDHLESLGTSVHWKGHIPRARIVEELQRAHIHVTPSRWDEPFGLVTLEAMSCGLPTVASRTGGTPEVVGDAAILFPRDDSIALSSSLRSLLRSATARKEWSIRGRRRACEMTWGKTWQAICESSER